MGRTDGTVKRWRPHPIWWGALTFTVTAVGLKFFLKATVGLHDVLPLILGGVAWFALSAYLGWLDLQD